MPVSRVSRSASAFIHATMRTVPRSASCTTHGTRPLSSYVGSTDTPYVLRGRSICQLLLPAQAEQQGPEVAGLLVRRRRAGFTVVLVGPACQLHQRHLGEQLHPEV